jgi:hypothetical protein
LKTNAAKLLEALCDHIDGATTFICEQAVMMLSDDEWPEDPGIR